MARTAKNYQARDAYKIVTDFASGKDRSMDNLIFMSRYPAFASAIQNKDVDGILKAIPYASARQMEKGLRGDVEIRDVEGDEGDEDAETEVETVAEPAPAPIKEKRAKKAEPEPEPEVEAEEEAEDEEPSKYAGMKPKVLYDMCVKSGLKVKTQQEASYYIEKLEYVDKKNAEAAAAKEKKAKEKLAFTPKNAAKAEKNEKAEDDWDEDEEKPAPVKAGKPKADKSKEDDWDF